MVLTFLVFTAIFSELAFAQEKHSTTRLESALKSLCVLRQLFDEHKETHSHTRPPNEEKHRIKMFTSTIKEVLELRRDPEIKWVAGLTFAADMTTAERKQLTGLNTSTLLEGHYQEVKPVKLSKKLSRVVEFDDWRQNGKVGPVRNQLKDSCWANSAVVPLEAQLAIYNHELKELSVQELYDCTYPPTYKINGVGGHPTESWKYVKKSGRLGLRKESPETFYPKRHVCAGLYDSKTNALDGYEVSSSLPFRVRTSEDLMHHLRIFSPIAVSVDTTGSRLLFYHGGTFNVPKGRCSSVDTDHSVVVVGYTAQTYIIRNSWGTLWGDKGYVNWDRQGDLCGLLEGAYYPFLDRK